MPQERLSKDEAEVADWRALVDCLERLLVCYRVGRHPSDKLLDDIGRLKKRLGLAE